MNEPFCPRHYPRKFRQCGCELPPPPTKPSLVDVCRWCLTTSYAAPFCGRLGHWRMIVQEYERDLVIWQKTYGGVFVPVDEQPSPVAPPSVETKTETRPAVSRVPCSAVMLVIPPGAREFLAAMGQRGGSSRSERKQAASRRNGQMGGRRRTN